MGWVDLDELDFSAGLGERLLPILSILVQQALHDHLGKTLNQSLRLQRGQTGSAGSSCEEGKARQTQNTALTPLTYLHQVHSWLQVTDLLENFEFVGIGEGNKLDIDAGGLRGLSGLCRLHTRLG